MHCVPMLAMKKEKELQCRHFAICVNNLVWIRKFITVIITIVIIIIVIIIKIITE